MQVVVVGPTDAGGSVPPPSDFLDPFARDLVSLQVPLAVGSSFQVATSFLSPIRQSTSGQMVTVDDLETPIGGAALALGMARLIDSNKGGNYGVESGMSLLPPTPSPTP